MCSRKSASITSGSSLNDFLPTVVSHEVLHDVLPHLHSTPTSICTRPGSSSTNPHNDMFMPLEFSAAAYRFGHSMVRPGYRLNDDAGPFPIFPLANDPDGTALTGFHEFPRDVGYRLGLASWISSRDRSATRTTRPTPAIRKRTQLAYKIDTSLVNPLAMPARPR